MMTQVEVENLYPSLEEFDAETQFFLSKFHQSKEAFHLTETVAKVAIAGIDLRKIGSIIAGKYFETIAGLYVQSKLQSNNLFVLNPSETDLIYQGYYANAHTCSLYNLYTIIPGITIPDGLIFQIGKKYLQLVGVCEYTALNRLTRSTQKLAQLEQYQQSEFVANDLGMSAIDCIKNAPEYGQKLRELLSHVRPDVPHLPITLVNPDFWKIIYAFPATSNEKKSNLPYVPLSSKDLNNYVTQLIDQVTNEYQSECQLLGIS